MSKVFISYRREDVRYQARLIREAFEEVLPPKSVFMDVDSIPPGADFVEFLEKSVGQCEILLALIGPGWIDAADPKTKQARLGDDKDFVRVEIRQALMRNIPVVPVLLDGALMPDEIRLPDDLKKLVRRQAEFVEFRTFRDDVRRLIRKLGLDAAQPTTPAPKEKVPSEEQREAAGRQSTEEERRAAEERKHLTVKEESLAKPEGIRAEILMKPKYYDKKRIAFIVGVIILVSVVSTYFVHKTDINNPPWHNQFVYLQFRGGLSRDVMRGLQTQLQTAGYSVPYIERLGGEYSNQVRYFRKDEEQDAKYVASIATKFFGEKCPLPPAFRETFISQDKPPQRIELLVSLNCPD